MFDALRARGTARSLATYLIFAAICLVFVFFGDFGGNLGGSAGYAARVNGTVISVGEYRNALEQMTEFYQNIYGEAGAPPQLEEQLRSQALEHLINEAVMIEQGSNEGLAVAAEEVRDLLLGIPAFQEDGKFQRTKYQQFLEGRRITAGQFEKDLRKQLGPAKVRRLFESGLRGHPDELEREKAAKAYSFNIEFLELDPEKIKKGLSASSQDVSAYIASEDGKKKVDAYYEANKAEFTTPESVKARHILIGTDSKTTDADALKKATEIRKTLTPETFSDVAKKESTDPGSKEKGGDLGFFEKGRMTPKFEEVAFTLEPGKVSDPVKTPFGYHLILVDEKKPEIVKPLEDARKTIASKLLAEERYNQELESLKASVTAREAAKIEAFRKKFDLKWVETGNFTLGDARIPKLGRTEGLFEGLSAAKVGEVLPQMVTGGFRSVVARRVQTKPQAKDPKKTELVETVDQIGRRRFGYVFPTWVERASEKAKIDRNYTALGLAPEEEPKEN